MKAATYCRISKDDRADQFGVDRQQQLWRRLAGQLGLDVGDVYVDNDRSAYNRNRSLPSRRAATA